MNIFIFFVENHCAIVWSGEVLIFHCLCCKILVSRSLPLRGVILQHDGI